ncbi:MAG: hypothetical protein MJZ63_06540 [Muribaculaceae bacterium]|nr:hypothetical protein [Muribaculaceae bacterium]
MKSVKFLSIAVLVLAMATAVPAYSAKRSSKSKKVTNTMGKYAPTSGCAVTNAKAVDLGLPSGTLWADRNVGAESPQAYGGLYRYGDKGKPSGEGCPRENIGGTKLDVATKKMGKKWRMPTAAQLVELWENCTYTHETIDGQKGFRLTGPNGNSIFLPMTGTMYSYGRSQAGEFGFYQSGEITGSEMYQVGFEVVVLQLWERDDETFTPGVFKDSVGQGNAIRAVVAQ